MSRPVIIATYWFASSSGSGTYETLQYSGGATSCGCPGWTRRVDSAGRRSCKHTRMVEAGIAKIHARNFTEYGTSQQPHIHIKPIVYTPAPAGKGRKPVPPSVPGQRKIIIT